MRNEETLERDLTDIANVVDGLAPLMGERYAEKFEARGTYMEETCQKILENLNRNVMQLANAVHAQDGPDIDTQCADILNLVAIVKLRADGHCN